MAASISAPVSGSSGCRGDVPVSSGLVVAAVSSVVVIADSFPGSQACAAVHTWEVSPRISADKIGTSISTALLEPGQAADTFAGDGRADLIPQLTFPFPVRFDPA